jgi:hypothetical protein
MSKEEINDVDFDNMFSEETVEGGDRKNVFTSPPDASVLDELDNEEESEEEKTDVDLDNLNNDEEEEEEEEKTIDSSPMLKAVSNLVEKGLIKVFIDDEGNPEKDLTEYTSEDFEELISRNIEDAVTGASQAAPVELFKRLPKSVQDVVVFSLNGAKESDLTSMFSQLSKVQETLDLDPTKKEDAIRIVREYHQMEGILSNEDIEDDITALEDRDTLTNYAEKYKKRLDEKQAIILKKRLADQDLIKKQELQNEHKKIQNVVTVLKSPDISGIVLDNDTKQNLFTGLAEKRFQSLNGEQVNELQYLLEQKQYGENPDMASVVLALAILKDPSLILNSLETKIRKEVSINAQEKIKDANRKIATHVPVSKTQVSSQNVVKKSGLKRNSVFSLGK